MSSEYSIVFCLSMCMLFGITYNQWVTFDVNQTVDPKTYWGLAHFNFDQSIVRKYRVLQPFIVAAFNWLFVLIGRIFRPDGFKGDFVLRLCFYISNMVASSAFCTLAYRYVRTLGRSKMASLVAVLLITTSYWTAFNTYAFMTDSLYCCFLTLTLIGISTRNFRMLFWCILIAPFSKEAYLFMLPVLFFFSGVPKLKMLGWFALSAIITFVFRYSYDTLTGHRMLESIEGDSEHFSFIANNFQRFTEPDYMNPFVATIGLWLFIPLAGMLLMRGFAKSLGRQIKGYMIAWLVLIFLQMLMSGDFARMFYCYLPVYAFFMAFTIDAWRQYLAAQKTTV